MKTELWLWNFTVNDCLKNLGIRRILRASFEKYVLKVLDE
jgi:hypothetical protein